MRVRLWWLHGCQRWCMWLWNRASDVMMWVDRCMDRIDDVLEEMEAGDEQA
jgi:hypothetical protein